MKILVAFTALLVGACHACDLCEWQMPSRDDIDSCTETGLIFRELRFAIGLHYYEKVLGSARIQSGRSKRYHIFIRNIKNRKCYAVTMRKLSARDDPSWRREETCRLRTCPRHMVPCHKTKKLYPLKGKRNPQSSDPPQATASIGSEH